MKICIKCGSSDLYKHYHDKGDGRYGDPCNNTDWENREHLDRGCRECSFKWCENVITAHLTPKE